MEKFTASRLLGRNKPFLGEIELDDHSLTVKVCGFFNDKPQTFNYEDISMISLYTPLIGYSTIAFFAKRIRVLSDGFTKSQVKRMKMLIEVRQANPIIRPVTKPIENLAPVGMPLFIIERIDSNKKKYNNNNNNGNINL